MDTADLSSIVASLRLNMEITASDTGTGVNRAASLPLVSLRPLLQNTPTRLDAARTLLDAFERDGFLYLRDYEEVLPQDLVNAVFANSAKFFARSEKEKNALPWVGPHSNRGYTRQGQEKTSNAMKKVEVSDNRRTEGEDMKESFEIGRDNEEGHPNQWPEDGSEETAAFKNTMLSMFDHCKEVHRILMRGIAIALEIEETFFEDFVRVGDNTLRLLHYPAVPQGGFEGGRKIRAGAHSDYGTVTLLFQDEKGGLQVERPGYSGWFDVTPREGTIVVNAGDLLERWSCNRIRSTKHHVVEPPGHHPDGGYPSRYSVAYFCHPDFHCDIGVLPNMCKSGAIGYEVVNSGEYLAQRLSATY